MIKGIVRYWNLGRNHAKGNFEVLVEDPNQEDKFNTTLLNEFSKHLLSNDIAFEDGKIFAGFRHVGNFEFVAFRDN